MGSHIAQNTLNSQSLRLTAPYLPHELAILQNLIIGDTKINNLHFESITRSQITKEI
ncbi:hypothetical protein [Endozoicomonas sp. GU-1]|uniref:hypothetical protein n=1 Tax=Endozoicomonas sp. GU-1 TaxID=3009078 RepID=UPI0022B48C38|nr:hypothetical protein [Endozoicomonas sp. GU-1]WBA81084.1 hypothetical protein O2T12_22750 [Endozoicomonas sp. GU-1]